MVSQQRCIHTLTHSASSLSFTSDGKTLVSFNRDDKTAKLWDVNTGQERCTFNEHSDEVRSVAFSPDNRILVSGSHDQTIKLWNLESGDVISTLSDHTAAVKSVISSPDGQMFVSGGSDQTIRIWRYD